MNYLKEPVRNRLMRNIETMRKLSDEEVRIININTSGGYIEEVIHYWPDEKSLPQHVTACLFPKQDKWIWYLKHHHDPNIKPNPVYDKAYHIIETVLERENSLPLRTKQEDAQLKDMLDSCPDFSSKLVLVGLSCLMRPDDDPVAKARRAARSAFTEVRERSLGFVKRYENRTMKDEDEYKYFTECTIEEFIDDTLVNQSI